LRQKAVTTLLCVLVLENEELHNLYFSSNIIRQIKSKRIRWAGHVARMEEGRKVYKVLVGTPVEERPLGRPRRRWDQNVRCRILGRLAGGGVDTSGSGWGWSGYIWLWLGVEWIHLAQDRCRWRAVVNAVMNLRVLALRS
jgi:hypothetical protein